jgi:hypothetical protein
VIHGLRNLLFLTEVIQHWLPQIIKIYIIGGSPEYDMVKEYDPATGIMTTKQIFLTG